MTHIVYRGMRNRLSDSINRTLSSGTFEWSTGSMKSMIGSNTKGIQIIIKKFLKYTSLSTAITKMLGARKNGRISFQDTGSTFLGPVLEGI
jgi:hypothetical protein